MLHENLIMLNFMQIVFDVQPRISLINQCSATKKSNYQNNYQNISDKISILFLHETKIKIIWIHK
jgi:hypothetical protein